MINHITFTLNLLLFLFVGIIGFISQDKELLVPSILGFAGFSGLTSLYLIFDKKIEKLRGKS